MVAAYSELTAEVHADYHRVIEAARLGPVGAFGSSGGGMCALHWVVAHPEDVRTLVSHEPPLVALLEDHEMAAKVTPTSSTPISARGSARRWRSSSSS